LRNGWEQLEAFGDGWDRFESLWAGYESLWGGFLEIAAPPARAIRCRWPEVGARGMDLVAIRSR
jgi:hypothetical protein